MAGAGGTATVGGVEEGAGSEGEKQVFLPGQTADVGHVLLPIGETVGHNQSARRTVRVSPYRPTPALQRRGDVSAATFG